MISRTLVFQLAIISTVHSATIPVYKAELTQLGSSGVAGLAVVSILSDGSVAYAGHASGVVASQSTCIPGNCLGAHIHEGTSCENADAQGGHYYDGLSDPWTSERYSSDANGIASFGSVLDIGTTNVVGRAFVLHNDQGGRVACGVLELVQDDDLLVAVSEADPDDLAMVGIDSYSVTGSAVVYNHANSGYACFAGTGQGLEPNLDADASDCTEPNGCGAHIHSGTSCVDKDSQGGHYHNLISDPWKNAGYRQTDGNGVGHFVGCLKTGEDSFEDRAFVLHNNGGTRVACGVLKNAGELQKEDCGPFEVFLHWILFIMTLGTVRLPCV